MTHKPRTTLSSASDIEMSKSDDVEERVQTKSGLDECRLWPEHTVRVLHSPSLSVAQTFSTGFKIFSRCRPPVDPRCLHVVMCVAALML